MENNVLAILRRTRALATIYERFRPIEPCRTTALVVCANRTGSTLLTRILDSHSAIAAPCEIGIPTVLSQDPKRKRIQTKTREMCRYYGLYTGRALKDPHYLLSRVLAKEKKKLLVIKDPRHALYMPELRQLLGDVPVIHLTRDIRASAMSVMYHGKVAKGMKMSANYNAAILRDLHLFSAHLTVKYEDLVDEPELEVRRLTEFLGLPFEPTMLSYWEHEHSDDKMKLWGGKKPEEVAIQRALSENRIAKKNGEFSPEVLAAYHGSERFVLINEQLGYRS